MRECPDSGLLLLYSEVDERAGAKRSQARLREVRRHLRSGCPSCARRVREYRRIRKSLRAPSLERAPATLVESALDQIAELINKTSGRDSVLRVPHSYIERLIASGTEPVRAVLALQPLAPAALAGIRGGASESRAFLYESVLGDLYLQILPKRGRLASLLGQFVPSTGTEQRDAEAVLESASRIWKRRIDARGSFRFDRVPSGALLFGFRVGRRIITIRDLRV
jgi:hypothetical protein